MLVLSRRAGESILIGENIEIRVLQVRGSGPSAVVRLGIVAPPEVKVLRAEVVEAVREENRLAAQSRELPEEAVQGILQAARKRREAQETGEPGPGPAGGPGGDP